MGLAVRLIVLIGLLLPRPAAAGDLERGLAVTDAAALQVLEHGIAGHPGFGLGRMLDPAGPAELSNDRLFALPAMAPVRLSLDGEFESYAARGQGAQLFDRQWLGSAQARFVLSGIVNRMDRGYLDPKACGEIRLIYRLTRTDAGEAPPRLPMTLTVVLKARDHQGARAVPDCSELARRWLASGELQLSGAALAAQLIAPDGALASLQPEQIDRIETNLQISHTPQRPRQDFRTDYLLRLFRLDKVNGRFIAAPLENQLDRERLLVDSELGRQFKYWLLQPEQIAALDRGTILLPERFVASRAIAVTPAGFERSERQPAFGLVAPAMQPLFSESDVVTALARATARGVALQNIRSPAGFERRLSDISCSGCHQTRGIGGFHFPGAAMTAAVVPASPLFFGDQIRRRDILSALRDGLAPDYSRGFADRPQRRGSTALRGTSYDDGWGAHCHVQGAGADPSFQSWSCAEGLSCQPVGTSGFGMCFVK